MAEVVRHGDRWGVVETPGEPPISEHATREAALLAAGPGATVREDDPTGLAGSEDSAARERGAEAPATGSGGAQPGEAARERQAGL
jgi:hypothetical protein